MELIDKAALLLEIDKREGLLDIDNPLGRGGMVELELIKDKIGTLKVQDVDLEKEILAFSKMELEPIKIYDANVSLIITMHQLYRCAQHFFKLGLKVNNGAVIENACEWLEKNIAEATGIDSYTITESFKQAMEK